jgi:hypothetical protein
MKNSNGYVGLSDFYSGRKEVIKGSAFVNSRRLRLRSVRDSDGSERLSLRFFIEFLQTDVLKEFNV